MFVWGNLIQDTIFPKKQGLCDFYLLRATKIVIKEIIEGY